MKFPRRPEKYEVDWGQTYNNWMDAAERNMRVTRHLVWICLSVGYMLGIIVEVFIR